MKLVLLINLVKGKLATHYDYLLEIVNRLVIPEKYSESQALKKKKNQTI